MIFLMCMLRILIFIKILTILIKVWLCTWPGSRIIHWFIDLGTYLLYFSRPSDYNRVNLYYYYYKEGKAGIVPCFLAWRNICSHEIVFRLAMAVHVAACLYLVFHPVIFVGKCLQTVKAREILELSPIAAPEFWPTQGTLLAFQVSKYPFDYVKEKGENLLLN